MSTSSAPLAEINAASDRRWPSILLALAAVALLILAPAAGDAEAAKKKKMRIAALTPFAVQTLARLNVKPVVIGETVTGDVNIPGKFRRVPQVPLSHGANGANPEQLLERRVDVVLSERTWKAGHKALRGFGLQVRQFDPVSLNQYPRKIKQLGRFVGKRKPAKRLAKSMRKKIRRATRGITVRPNTLVLLGVGRSAYAFLPNSWGGDLFGRAGANLLTEGLSSEGGSSLMISGGFAQLQTEEILARQPDVIVAIPHGNAEDLDEIRENLENDEFLKMTNAGQNDRIYVTGDNSLLQPDLRVPRVIKTIRESYLRNR